MSSEKKCSKDESLQKLHSHIPSASTNEELIQLQVIGTSVFDAEKAYAQDLVTEAKLQSDFKLMWHKQDKEKEQAQEVTFENTECATE